MKVRHLANLVLAGGGILALSALFFFVYRYAWTGERQFTSVSAAVLHYTVLAGLSCLLFVSLRFRQAFKITVAALCLSLAAGMYLAEVMLTPSYASGILPFWGLEQNSADKQNAIAALEAAGGVGIDGRDRAELLAGLNNHRVDAVPAVMLGRILAPESKQHEPEAQVLRVRSSNPVNAMPTELMPIGGVAGTLTVLCNESGQYVSYESDEHGFRNPRGIWNSAHADIAALGESFIQGYCVPDGKVFVDLFRKNYPVTLNLGMSGESSLLQLAAMKEYLPHYAPKTVLWFFCEGIDLRDLRDESEHPLLVRYLEPDFSQHLMGRQPEINDALRTFISDSDRLERERSHNRSKHPTLEKWLAIVKLSALREKLGLVYGINSNDQDADALSLLDVSQPNLLSETLGQAQALAHGWGGSLYFVYLPSWNRYGKDPKAAEVERLSTLKLVSALGIPVIDVQAAFQAQKDPLALFPIRKFGHYNELGNQVVADTVLQFLSDRELATRVAGGPPVPSR